MNVLIVEDNPISSKVLEHTLEGVGHETYTAKDGEQGLEYLETHPEIQLVITDIVMPRTDGFELVRRIKNHPELKDTPILVCTSQSPASINNRLPMEGWRLVLKPIRAASLMQKINEIFAQQRPVLQNPDETMSQMGIDSHAYMAIIDEFVKVVKDKIAMLDENIKTQSSDYVDLQDLTEGAKLLRADRVTDILDKLDRCPAGRKAEMVRSLYPTLARELKAMQYYLTLYSA